jgi:hypothetical protein
MEDVIMAFILGREGAERQWEVSSSTASKMNFFPTPRFSLPEEKGSRKGHVHFFLDFQ